MSTANFADWELDLLKRIWLPDVVGEEAAAAASSSFLVQMLELDDRLGTFLKDQYRHEVFGASIDIEAAAVEAFGLLEACEAAGFLLTASARSVLLAAAGRGVLLPAVVAVVSPAVLSSFLVEAAFS